MIEEVGHLSKMPLTLSTFHKFASASILKRFSLADWNAADLQKLSKNLSGLVEF